MKNIKPLKTLIRAISIALVFALFAQNIAWANPAPYRTEKTSSVLSSLGAQSMFDRITLEDIVEFAFKTIELRTIAKDGPAAEDTLKYLLTPRVSTSKHGELNISFNFSDRERKGLPAAYYDDDFNLFVFCVVTQKDSGRQWKYKVVQRPKLYDEIYVLNVDEEFKPDDDVSPALSASKITSTDEKLEIRDQRSEVKKPRKESAGILFKIKKLILVFLIICISTKIVACSHIKGIINAISPTEETLTLPPKKVDPDNLLEIEADKIRRLLFSRQKEILPEIRDFLRTRSGVRLSYAIEMASYETKKAIPPALDELSPEAQIFLLFSEILYFSATHTGRHGRATLPRKLSGKVDTAKIYELLIGLLEHPRSPLIPMLYLMLLLRANGEKTKVVDAKIMDLDTPGEEDVYEKRLGIYDNTIGPLKGQIAGVDDTIRFDLKQGRFQNPNYYIHKDGAYELFNPFVSIAMSSDEKYKRLWEEEVENKNTAAPDFYYRWKDATEEKDFSQEEQIDKPEYDSQGKMWWAKPYEQHQEKPIQTEPIIQQNGVPMPERIRKGLPIPERRGPGSQQDGRGRYLGKDGAITPGMLWRQQNGYHGQEPPAQSMPDNQQSEEEIQQVSPDAQVPATSLKKQKSPKQPVFPKRKDPEKFWKILNIPYQPNGEPWPGDSGETNMHAGLYLADSVLRTLLGIYLLAGESSISLKFTVLILAAAYFTIKLFNFLKAQARIALKTISANPSPAYAKLSMPIAPDMQDIYLRESPNATSDVSTKPAAVQPAPVQAKEPLSKDKEICLGFVEKLLSIAHTKKVVLAFDTTIGDMRDKSAITVFEVIKKLKKKPRFKEFLKNVDLVKGSAKIDPKGVIRLHNRLQKYFGKPNTEVFVFAREENRNNLKKVENKTGVHSVYINDAKFPDAYYPLLEIVLLALHQYIDAGTSRDEITEYLKTLDIELKDLNIKDVSYDDQGNLIFTLLPDIEELNKQELIKQYRLMKDFLTKA